MYCIYHGVRMYTYIQPVGWVSLFCLSHVRPALSTVSVLDVISFGITTRYETGLATQPAPPVAL